MKTGADCGIMFCAGNAQKMENSKMMLERQNKELKAKLEEAENSNRAKAKAAIGKLFIWDPVPF